MKTETKIIISLLLLAPILGELVTASTPPLSFFNPFVLLILIFFYGCGALLIREAKARWGLQWSVVFLAMAYGVIIEGLVIQTFFNPGNPDLGALSGFGMLLGVQWPWTFMLIFSHATISTLIPISIVGLLWPKYNNVPLLKKRGIILSFAAFILTSIFGMIVIAPLTFEAADYSPNPILLGITFLITLLLIWLAYKFKDSKFSSDKHLSSTFKFGMLGFLFILLNSLLIPFLLGEFSLPAYVMILAQFLLFVFVSKFAINQIYNKNVTKHHIVSFIFGSVLFWILLTPVYEFNLAENPDPTQGMLLVGIVSLILLIIWRRTVLKK